jgi:hypothetical protein
LTSKLGIETAAEDFFVAEHRSRYRSQAIEKLLAPRIVILDGAMGI